MLEQALGPSALLSVQPGRQTIAPNQLVPVTRALSMTRARLLLADGVGLKSATSRCSRGRDPAWTAHVRELPINLRQKRAIVAFSDGRKFQSTDYQQINQVDRDVAYRDLQRIHRSGLIEREGQGKGTRYRVSVNVP